ncbi:MAG TPA: MBL fold metallo-hydrolase [Actinomycetota bacterium]|nr:MBL fold metallo-hydrolase [Actinomycetota bacterium]
MLDRFTWHRQSSYLWRGDGINVYIDPWGVTAEPPADVLFITHAHGDHFDPESLDKVVREGSTKIVAPHDIAAELSGNVTPIAPGDSGEAGGIRYQCVPAYNVVEERLEMHPRSNNWVGFILELGEYSYYHAGDTDHVPELDSVKVDVSFVPIGGTYTMDVPEAAELVKAQQPKLAVPMHYGFVVGTPADADRFAAEVAPIEVQMLEPTNPFEKTE